MSTNKLSMIDEIKNAHYVLEKYNKIPLDEFVNKFETYFGKKIEKKEKESFRFSGLLNTDLVKLRKGLKYEHQ